MEVEKWRETVNQASPAFSISQRTAAPEALVGGWCWRGFGGGLPKPCDNLPY